MLSVTGGLDLSLHEVNKAAEMISQAVDDDANFIFGAVIDEDLEDEIRITVIATGFDARPKESVFEEVDIKPLHQSNDLDIPAFMRRRR